MEGGLLLNVVVRQGVTILKLLLVKIKYILLAKMDTVYNMR